MRGSASDQSPAACAARPSATRRWRGCRRTARRAGTGAEQGQQFPVLLPGDTQSGDLRGDAESVAVGEAQVPLVGGYGLGLVAEGLHQPGAQPPAGAGVLALGQDGVADDQGEVQLVVVAAFQGLVGDGEQGVQHVVGDAGGGGRRALDDPLEAGGGTARRDRCGGGGVTGGDHDEQRVRHMPPGGAQHADREPGQIAGARVLHDAEQHGVPLEQRGDARGGQRHQHGVPAPDSGRRPVADPHPAPGGDGQDVQGVGAGQQHDEDQAGQVGGEVDDTEHEKECRTGYHTRIRLSGVRSVVAVQEGVDGQVEGDPDGLRGGDGTGPARSAGGRGTFRPSGRCRAGPRRGGGPRRDRPGCPPWRSSRQMAVSLDQSVEVTSSTRRKTCGA
ncbi:hypothetical protein SHIRM173S_00001 [Streptomyces hirsutus]